MQENSSKRGSALLLPPIAKRNHNKSTRDRDFPKRAQISARILLTRGRVMIKMN
jgi:hypothetical protein